MKLLNQFARIFITTLFFVSCGTERPSGKTQAEILFKEANELMESERYILATEKLAQLRSKYPYSYYATPSELMMADILFLQENYVEAAASYLVFKDLHPKHEKIPYVMSRVALSYYKQIPSTYDRDLHAAKEAIKYFKQIIDFYSGSAESVDAKKKIKECEELLMDKERYIADFYFRTEVYQAARYRYKTLLNIPRLKKEFIFEAFSRILISSLERGKKSECLRDYGLFNYEPLSKSEKKKLKSLYKSCLKLKEEKEEEDEDAA